MGNPRHPIQKSDGRLTGPYKPSLSHPHPTLTMMRTPMSRVLCLFPLATGRVAYRSSTDTPTPPPPVALQETKLRSSVPDTTSVQHNSLSQAGNISEKRSSVFPQTKVSNTVGFPGLFYSTPGSFAERSVSM